MGYEPSPLLALRRGLRGRELRPDDVFLDLGCGKGRVLVDAVQLPFARVVGVELVPELVEQARANLARVEHAGRQRRGRLRRRPGVRHPR